MNDRTIHYGDGDQRCYLVRLLGGESRHVPTGREGGEGLGVALSLAGCSVVRLEREEGL